jgi:hypothetical protein
MADLSVRYGRVVIEFCTACKWNLRAAYVSQSFLFVALYLPDLVPMGFRPGSRVFPHSLKMSAPRSDPAFLSSETLSTRSPKGTSCK